MTMLYLIALDRLNYLVIRVYLGKLLKYYSNMVIYILNICIGFSLVSMYMIDVNFISDNNKFASGILQ